MMQSVQDQILCNESNWPHVKISHENIKKAIQYLKREKVDGIFDLVSNNFINAPDCMIMYLSDLYTCCLQNGLMLDAGISTTQCTCTASEVISYNNNIVYCCLLNCSKVSMYVCMNVCMYLCMYVCMYV